MKPMRRQFQPRRWKADLPLPSAIVGVLLFTLLLLSACSSSNGNGATVTTVTSGGLGQSGGATSGSSAQVGGPGPGGVGTVVAGAGGSGTYVDITADELATMLKNKDFLFINVHIPYAGEIEQTDLFLPYDKAAQQLDQLPADKNAKIVVYCRSDRMSRISVDQWVKAGYTNLYNLDGGFEAWEAAGYKLLHK